MRHGFPGGRGMDCGILNCAAQAYLLFFSHQVPLARLSSLSWGVARGRFLNEYALRRLHRPSRDASYVHVHVASIESSGKLLRTDGAQLQSVRPLRSLTSCFAGAFAGAFAERSSGLCSPSSMSQPMHVCHVWGSSHAKTRPKPRESPHLAPRSTYAVSTHNARATWAIYPLIMKQPEPSFKRESNGFSPLRNLRASHFVVENRKGTKRMSG
ncbi:hypothetical protein B0J13DRAFT_518169 [Dactylonectria estremocensis]|uniref:Uncharacterized protein n=1 Tax=Dactylonectria estremocensis TaxID=1079267 RepID=A0A9P9FJJ1_9HYPO|nr:hypothetical protein B0J13DRAFT_518169 [Dactylonectria estremocensis]